MIKKILWATDGSEDSFAALQYAEVLAKKCNADILGLAVLSDDYEFIDALPDEAKRTIKDRIQNDLETIATNRFKDTAKKLEENGLKFSYKLSTGFAPKKINEIAENEKVDLIALGKGRSSDKFILGETVLKVLRNSNIPVLTTRADSIKKEIKNILVPVALSHRQKLNFEYAQKLSDIFDSQVHLINIVETSDYNFPTDLEEKIKIHAQRDLKNVVGTHNMSENARIYVEAARNAWVGITDIAKKNNIDLIIMMSYGGVVLKEGFIGSIAWKVIQQSTVPVITLSPHKTILKMTGDPK